jgi:hypothetical protein
MLRKEYFTLNLHAILQWKHRNPDDIYRAIKEQMNDAGLAENFLGFLQSLLYLPITKETGYIFLLIHYCIAMGTISYSDQNLSYCLARC